MYGGQRRSLRSAAAAAAASQPVVSVVAEGSGSSGSSAASASSVGSDRSGGSGNSGGQGSSGGAATNTQQSQGSLAQLMPDSQASNLHVEETSINREDEDDEDFGDMHRLVLQGVMSAGYLDAKGVKKLFQESCRFLQCKYLC